jgi:hypothetical protein
MTKLQKEENEPTIAPGVNTEDVLDQQASEREVRNHDSTSVTRLESDRTTEE